MEPIGDRGTIYIYETGQIIPLIAEIRNPMYYEASNIRLNVSNYNNNLIGLDTWNEHSEQSFSLNGNNQQTGTGGITILESNINVGTLRNQPYTTRIRFHLCANTKTIFETGVCLRPNRSQGTYSAPCNPVTITDSQGQGAPVAVTRIEQFDSGKNVALKIRVINRGKGLVYSSESGSGCGVITQSELGRVKIEAYLSQNRLNCDKDEELMGYDTAYQSRTGTEFTCIIDKSILGIEDYTTTSQHAMRVILSYDYYEELPSQNIIIKNAPGYTSP